MRILALETTEAIGSVAAAVDGNLLLENQLDPQQRSAQSLAPAIQAVLKEVGWRPSDVELVAVTIGPGSFTGLRVGVVTAKSFAYGVGAQILGVDTLLAIAAAAPDEVRRLSAAVDAQRGDVVAGLFRRESDGWCVHVGPARLVPADTWLRELPAEVPVTGPILRKFSERLPPGVRALDAAFWAPRAGNVARVAAHLHAAGRRDDLWTLVPLYSRRPAAEEKWEEKQRKAGDVKRFR